MKQCPFCHLSKQETIIFSTSNFVFISAKTPITPNHHLLVSKQHIISEIDISKEYWEEYCVSSRFAWSYMQGISGQDPLIFINPVQMQSVAHFHKHFLDGIFGIHGVAIALSKTLV